LPSALVCAGLACLEMLSESSDRRDRLAANTRWFRRTMTDAGFAIRPGEHPIVPIMLGDAHLAHQMATDLLARDIYVVGFPTPWSRRDRRASACRSAPRTSRSTSSAPWPHS
jgi:glycine C-acetyltransferase